MRGDRYPVHFHLMGNASYDSWVANCSVHHTWNRAVTIHGTHAVRASSCGSACAAGSSAATRTGAARARSRMPLAMQTRLLVPLSPTQVRVSHNAAFATTGHTYFLEDGVETGNVLLGNLGMLTQVSNGMLITDNNPATFWVTHPNNILIGNVAAGAAARCRRQLQQERASMHSCQQQLCSADTRCIFCLRNHHRISRGLWILVPPAGDA